ncbi:transglycosylase SLT domain-containing protein, partial [Kaarinaea lacus]
MMPVAKSRKTSLNRIASLMTVLLVLLAISISSAQAAKRQPIDNELRKVLIEAANSSDSFTDRFEAEVWLSDMSNRLSRYMPDPEDRIQFLKNVHYEAKRADLAPELVLSVIHVESLFNRWAISSVGAQGFMQVMPFW